MAAETEVWGTGLVTLEQPSWGGGHLQSRVVARVGALLFITRGGEGAARQRVDLTVGLLLAAGVLSRRLRLVRAAVT